MTTRQFRKILTSYAIARRKLHTTAKSSCFYQINPKSGYDKKYDNLPPPQNFSIISQLRSGYQHLKREFGLWIEEVKETLRNDPILIYRPNEVDIVWQFKGDPEELKQWVLTCDSDYNEGFSTAK